MKPHIVILGAGFAGTAVARELARLLPRPEDATITVVDQDNYFLFTPLLTEVAGGMVDPRDIVSAVRSLAPRVTFDQGKVERIDATRQVVLRVGDAERGVPETRRTVTADHLVIALGSVTAFHHIPGLFEHAVPIKTVHDAVLIRDRVLALLERADEESDPQLRRALLTFVVGGGGTAGVEVMGALNDLVRTNARHYPRIEPGDIQTVLIEFGPRLLSEMSEGLAVFTRRELERRGVVVHLNTEVTKAGPDYVEVEPKGGRPRRIPEHLLVWAGGITPNPVVTTLDVPKGRHGGIVVNDRGEVPGFQGLWALGDDAEFPRPNHTGTYAPLAQNATREGTAVARNIVATMRGQATRPFTYHPIGEFAVVGRHAAVANVYGFHISGIFAWAMWRLVYLMKLPRLEQRVRVALNWTLDLFFGRDMLDLPGERRKSGA